MVKLPEHAENQATRQATGGYLGSLANQTPRRYPACQTPRRMARYSHGPSNRGSAWHTLHASDEPPPMRQPPDEPPAADMILASFGWHE